MNYKIIGLNLLFLSSNIIADAAHDKEAFINRLNVFKERIEQKKKNCNDEKQQALEKLKTDLKTFKADKATDIELYALVNRSHSFKESSEQKQAQCACYQQVLKGIEADVSKSNAFTNIELQSFSQFSVQEQERLFIIAENAIQERCEGIKTDLTKEDQELVKKFEALCWKEESKTASWSEKLCHLLLYGF